MGRTPRTDLSPKQLQALALFREGGHSRKEIADAIGVGQDYLNHLITGNVKVCGQIAPLFQKEWQKIDSDRDENLQRLIKETTEKVTGLMLREAETLQNKKKLTNPEKRLLSLYKNSLTQSKQSVNIKNLSYSYTQGLTTEDLMHEFTRLTGIAESSFNRRPVQNIEPDGPGSLSEGPEPGS